MLILLLLLMTISPANDPETFKWENRLIILYQLDELDAIRQLQEISEDRDGYIDRDLKIVLLKTDLPKDSAVDKLNDLIVQPDNPKLWVEHFRLEEIETPMYILVGKDGGKKMNEVELITNDLLFRVIDAMPMRQREMRKDTGS